MRDPRDLQISGSENYSGKLENTRKRHPAEGGEDVDVPSSQKIIMENQIFAPRRGAIVQVGSKFDVRPVSVVCPCHAPFRDNRPIFKEN